MAQAEWIRYGNAGGAKAQQIARLREMFANIGGGFAQTGAQFDTGKGGDNGPTYERAWANPEFERIAQSIGLANARSLMGPLGLTGGYSDSQYQDIFAGDNGMMRVLRPDAKPDVFSFTTDAMADPEREGKRGAYTLSFGGDGTLRDVSWANHDLSKGFLGDNMSWLGPLLVGGLAALGSAGAGAAGAGAAGGSGGASLGTGLTAGAGGTTGLTAGAAGVTGVTAPAGFVLAPELGAGVAGAAGGAAGGYMGGLNPAQSGVGLQMPSAPSLGSMGGGQGLVQAGVAPMSAESLLPLAGATQAPSLVQRALSFAKAASPYTSLLGPTMSLLGGVEQLGSLPQQPADAPRLPGASAPPEARGFDPQAGVAPIIDVLNRNRRAGKNRTQLTGSRGVSMASTRVGGNTLLGA